MANIVDFKFVPWGNGRVSKNGEDQNSTTALSALLAQVIACSYPSCSLFFRGLQVTMH